MVFRTRTLEVCQFSKMKTGQRSVPCPSDVTCFVLYTFPAHSPILFTVFVHCWISSYFQALSWIYHRMIYYNSIISTLSGKNQLEPIIRNAKLAFLPHVHHYEHWISSGTFTHHPPVFWNLLQISSLTFNFYFTEQVSISTLCHLPIHLFF